MAISTLTIDINAKLASLEKDMGKAARIAEQNAAKMQAAFSSASKALGAIGAALSVGAFANMVKGVADMGDQLGKLSTRTGVAIEELSKLQYAASLSDVSNEDLANSLGRLNRVLGEAADGGKEATDALARFGIAPGTMDAAEAFKQIAEKVKNTSDQTKIASAMNDIFGRSWQTLVPLIKNGSAGLKDAGDELERMGGVISTDLAKASEQFNDNLTRINTSVQALKIGLGNDLIPWLTRLSEEFLAARKAGLTFWESMTGIGLSNPFKSAGAQIVSITKEIDDLKKQMSGEGLSAKRLADFGLPDYSAEITKLEKLREYYKAINNMDVGNLTDSWMPKSKTSDGITGTPKDTKKTKTGKQDDPLGDFINDRVTPQLKTYEQALDSFRQMQLDAAVSGADLTAAEKKFYDLINSPEWATMGEPWKELVTQQFEAANAAEQAASAQERLNALLAETPTTKIEKLTSDIQFLTDKLNEGRISQQQFEEAVYARVGYTTDKVKETTDAMATFAEQAARNMQDAMAEFLFDPFENGVQGMLQSFGTMLQKLVAQAVAADLAKRMFGEFGGGEKGSTGWLGALASFFTNANGGVYTSPSLSAYSGQVVSTPTVFPFAKGIGLMGEAGPEAILPLKRGSDGKLGVQSAGSNQTINVYVSGTSAPDMRRSMAQGAREMLQVMNGARRYG